jgi:hypothetical protein
LGSSISLLGGAAWQTAFPRVDAVAESRWFGYVTMGEYALADEGTEYRRYWDVLPVHVVTIVDIVPAVAERLQTGDHGWLEIRLIGNTERDKHDCHQAEHHETLSQSVGASLGTLMQKHSRRKVGRPTMDVKREET